MSWQDKIYESLVEDTDAKKAAMTNPQDRTPEQQRAYEKARKRYQKTGKTPFKVKDAARREQRIKDAGL